MSSYTVYLAVLYSTEVEADNADEAVDMAIQECEYDPELSVPAQVVCEETGEKTEVPLV